MKLNEDSFLVLRDLWSSYFFIDIYFYILIISLLINEFEIFFHDLVKNTEPILKISRPVQNMSVRAD